MSSRVNNTRKSCSVGVGAMKFSSSVEAARVGC